LSRDEIQAWVDKELDGVEVLDWPAFSKLATALAVQRNKASLAFSLIDQDRKGVIVLEDLRRVANELGEEMNDEDLQEMMDEVDQLGEGLLNQEDFMKIARRVKL
jgi:Ca2+-binding EF-hand superfamily protein